MNKNPVFFLKSELDNITPEIKNRIIKAIKSNFNVPILTDEMVFTDEYSPDRLSYFIKFKKDTFKKENTCMWRTRIYCSTLVEKLLIEGQEVFVLIIYFTVVNTVDEYFQKNLIIIFSIILIFAI